MDKNDFFIVRSPLSLNIGQFKGIDGFKHLLVFQK